MDAFEALRNQLDSTRPESGVVFLSQREAREILAEHQRLARIGVAFILLPDADQVWHLEEADRFLAGDVSQYGDIDRAERAARLGTAGVIPLPKPEPVGPRPAA